MEKRSIIDVMYDLIWFSIPQLILMSFLFWAFSPNNTYGYYILLRVVSCIIFIYLAYRSYKHDKIILMIVFIINALIYNPIIQFHFSRGIWTIINIVSIIICFISIIVFEDIIYLWKNRK